MSKFELLGLGLLVMLPFIVISAMRAKGDGWKVPIFAYLSTAATVIAMYAGAELYAYMAT